MSPWKPIETAPKDGTAFLAYVASLNADRQDITIIHWSGWVDGVWETSIGHKLGVDREPTHWMPLP
jgi:hypothetical protein